ncbi:MAG: transglycosylase domain-containing protein [Pseudomonadota bacterium]
MGGLIPWLLVGAPLLIACGLISAGAGGLLAVYFHFSKDLPKIPDLRAYRPKTVSTFYAEDGSVIGLYYKEKRFPASLKSLPPHVINAFLAAEDARFFSHTGLDWPGIIRAALKNLQASDYAQGASTITQQVTRNFILTREKKLSRKIREALLAIRLEKTLSKEEILELYLNEIYLGSGAYGIEAAAMTYFGKNAAELAISEAALLAGLPASPSKYSPNKNLDAALGRRAFVLRSMLRNNFITQEQFDQASQESPKFRDNLPSPHERAPHFTEEVRRYIVEKYGEDQLYNEGLQVWTTCDPALQKKASEALQKGALAWEKRQGRSRGLVERLKPKEARAFLGKPLDESLQPGDAIKAVVMENHSPKKRKKNDPDALMHDCTLRMPGDLQFRMVLESEVPYRTYDLLEFDVVRIEERVPVLRQRRSPPIQGALVCIENRTGYVKALVGGMDEQQSGFNRAVQALRQPGSAFKPFVYAAALEWGLYSPYSIIVDEPIAVVVNAKEQEWVPGNSDRRFLGPITLRRGLSMSRNVTTIKLLMDVGIEDTVKMARRMGIESPLRKNLSLCLGSSEVTPLELTSAYAVFPNLGTRVRPVLVKKVVDRFGRVLEDNTTRPIAVTDETLNEESATRWLKDRLEQRDQHPDAEVDAETSDSGDQEELRRPSDGHRDPSRDDDEDMGLVLKTVLAPPLAFRPLKVWRRAEPERVLSPQTAYFMIDMLHDACVSGTASEASKLKRKDIAGKTGTTDDATDAWFVGFNPQYTTGVWMGYDAKVSLGSKEYGNRAALPVWMDFTAHILRKEPVGGWPVPPGIVFWDNERAQKGNLADLLQAVPDLEGQIAAKHLCPTDSPVTHASAPGDGGVPSYGPQDSYSGHSPYGGQYHNVPGMPPYPPGLMPPPGGYLPQGHAGYPPNDYPPYGPQTAQSTLPSPYGPGPNGDEGIPNGETPTPASLGSGRPSPYTLSERQPFLGGFYPGYQSDSMRVLDSDGRTLGYAPFRVDERGKMTVYRDYMTQEESAPAYGPPPPQTETETSDGAPPRSFWPEAAGFLRGLHNMVAPGGR